MALIHHSSQNYNEAASEAAIGARKIMNEKIALGRSSAKAIFERIQREVPVDVVAKSKALTFSPTETGIALDIGGKSTVNVHKHALTQMAGKAGIPGAYLAELVSGKEWQKVLAANVLNEEFHKGQADDRYLIRSINNEARGFLSNRFRRLDSRPLLEAFAAACEKIGAVPVDGTGSDTRVTLKAFLPMVFEPVPNEPLCIGIEWGNSDFGAARHTLRAFIWRLFCTNKATVEDSMAQVHLGRQLGDDIEFSKRTYDLDTRTSVSALNDVIAGVLGPAKVNLLLEGIKSANDKQVDWKHLKTKLARKLLKGELKAVEDAFESADTYNLPPGASVWRASNAVSWIAGSTTDPDRKLELERVAGEVLTGTTDKEVAVEAA